MRARPYRSPDEHSRDTLRGRLRFDPVIVGVAAVALTVYGLHGFQGKLTRDMGIYAYAGQQVADGVPPYLGVLNRAGPLAHLLPGLGAWGARLFHVDDLLGMRLFFMLIATACVVATYCLGRDLFSSRVAGLVSAATFLSFLGFMQHATYGPRDKTPMVLFLVLALIAMTRRRWLAAGLWLGLATLVLQIVAFVGLPAVLVAALLTGDRRDRWRSVARVAVGGLIPFLVITAWFAAVGALREFADAYVLINARYTIPSPVTDDLSEVIRLMGVGYGLSNILLVAGLVAVLVLAGLSLRPGGRDDDDGDGNPDAGQRAPLCGLAVGLLCGLVWTSRDFDSWPDAYPLLPIAAVGVGGTLHHLLRPLSPRSVVAVVLVWCSALTAFALNTSLNRGDRLGEQRASVRSVLGVLPADATIMSIEAPQPLVLAGLTNLSRYQMFSAGLQDYQQDTWPGGIKGYQRWMIEQEPTLIVIKSSGGRGWAKSIKKAYFLVGCAPGWAWYADRSLPPDTVRALEDLRMGGCPARHRRFRE